MTTGDYSHAEGWGNISGVKAYQVDNITYNGNGTSTLVYTGNITGSFVVGTPMLITDEPLDNLYEGGLGVYITSSVMSGSSTVIGVNYDLTWFQILGSCRIGSTTDPYSGTITGMFGNYAHAEGTGTYALGSYTHAEGTGTRAVGNGTHAEGLITYAVGNHSHAEGNITRAIGVASHAEGYHTVAEGAFQHVQGKFNVSSSEEGAFIVGGGQFAERRNLIYAASGSGVQITGSLRINDLIVLAPRTTTPGSPTEGMIIASGSVGASKLYYYNGTSWNALF